MPEQYWWTTVEVTCVCGFSFNLRSNVRNGKERVCQKCSKNGYILNLGSGPNNWSVTHVDILNRHTKYTNARLIGQNPP